MSFADIPFNSTPNFKFQEIIDDKADCLTSTYQFDCYKEKSGRLILISPFFDIKNAVDLDYHIRLLNLETKEVLKKLEGHLDRVTMVRYFQDPSNRKNYLVSADKRYSVLVWDLTDDCTNSEKIYEVSPKYEAHIYSCLLIFREEKMFLATSSIDSNNPTKVYELELHKSNQNYNPVDLRDTNNCSVYFMANWYNEQTGQNIIIQNTKNKIRFTEYPNNQTYHILETGEKYPYNQAGIVFKIRGEDFYAHSCTYGLVQIFDLAKKELVKKIEIGGDVHLYSFVFWNENYLLLNDCLQRRIIVFDIFDDYKVKSKVLCPEMYFEKFIEKIVHPVYGESILSVGIDWKIKLYVNRSLLDDNSP